jgi:hypothetical protein
MAKFIPTLPEVSRETITVLAGLLIAAYILSRFPNLAKFVSGQSITLKNQNGGTIF